MIATRAWHAALVALALGGAGCQTPLGPSDKDLLGVVERFHHDIRWKYSQQAAARVPPHQAADFLEKLEEMKDDLNITAWDVRKVEPLTKEDEEPQRVAIRMHLEYYLMPSTVLREVTVEQVWEQVNDAWVCMSIRGGPVEFEATPPPDADGGVPAADGAEEKAPPPPPAGEGARRPVEDLPDEGAEGG